MVLDVSTLKKEVGSAWDVHLFEEIDSTNTRLLEDVKRGKADTGTVYIAKSQSAGRGRLGRSFISPDGGLYMSFCAGDIQHALSTVICAVAVFDTLCSHGFSPEIKWVNDILIEGKKICGILAQSTGDGKRAVIGIGINFIDAAIPEELGGIAAGLDRFCRKTPKKELVASEILKRYKTLSDSLPDGRDRIIARYKEGVALLGHKVTVLGTGETVLATDVDSTGALITLTEDGKTLRLTSGEVSIRKITTN